MPKNLYLKTKHSFMTPIFLFSSYFTTHPITLLLEILGDGCMGRPPPPILEGPFPPAPLKSPPMFMSICCIRYLFLRNREIAAPIIIMVVRGGLAVACWTAKREV